MFKNIDDISEPDIMNTLKREEQHMMELWQETKDHTNKLMQMTIMKGRPAVDHVSIIYDNNLLGAMNDVLRYIAVYGHDNNMNKSYEFIRESVKILDKKGHL